MTNVNLLLKKLNEDIDYIDDNEDGKIVCLCLMIYTVKHQL